MHPHYAMAEGVPTPRRGVSLYGACRIHSCLGESVFGTSMPRSRKQREYMLRVDSMVLSSAEIALGDPLFSGNNPKEIIHSG